MTKKILLEDFKQHLSGQENSSSKSTVKNYMVDVNHFLTWFENKHEKEFNPKEVSFKTIQDFKKDFSVKISSPSLDRHLSSLRKFFKFLKIEGIIVRSPFEAIKK